jgi:hypothetical protein
MLSLGHTMKHDSELLNLHIEPLTSVSLTGEFSPNFDLKNMILTYTKDVS